MLLSPRTPRIIAEPGDLLMLTRGSKDGIVFGIESWKTPEGSLEPGYDRYGDKLQPEFIADLEYLHVVAARDSWVHFKNWRYDSRNCSYEHYRCSMEQFMRPGFREAEVAYALTLEWYAPKGWHPPLKLLGACFDE